MSEVPGLNGLENVLTFGDFGSIDKNFRIFQFNFFDGCIVVKAQIAQNLRFVMAKIDSVFFHFAFDWLIIYSLDFKDSHSWFFIFVVHLHDLVELFLEVFFRHWEEWVDDQQSSDSPFSCLWAHLLTAKLADIFLPVHFLFEKLFLVELVDVLNVFFGRRIVILAESGDSLSNY